MENFIHVKGARENNLKNIDVSIPKNKFVVITGPSGSGKSSLAFDTIFNEGKRRYIESLSSYARQFLGGSEKPDVDSIDGLSPAISIDQKTGSNNPRSTVGTITEVNDYLRLLFARIGTPYCPNHGIEIKAQSAKEIADKIHLENMDGRIILSSIVVNKEKGTHQKILAHLLKEGYSRVIVDGEKYNLIDEIEDIKLDKNKKHTIEVIVDRIAVSNDVKPRVLSSIEIALELGKGELRCDNTKDITVYSQNFSCPKCGFTVPDLEPRLFSFNAPFGACKKCAGIGSIKEPDIDLIVPDKSLSINKGAIQMSGFREGGTYYMKMLIAFLDFNNISADVPFSSYTNNQIDMIMYGTKQDILLDYESDAMQFKKNFQYEGIANNMLRLYVETSSESRRKYLDSLMAQHVCSSCNGSRLSAEVLSVKIAGVNIHELADMPIRDGYKFLTDIKLLEEDMKIGHLIFEEIKNRYNFLINVGLDYLSLTRQATTLSGGEAQRIRLATQIGSKLTGVLYVLDEPSIGLHQRDNHRLIETLKSMRDLGNTLIVVEHDEDTMKEADYIVDIGPGSGRYGGEVIAEGTPKELMLNDESLTGQYLCGKKKVELPKKRRKQNSGYIKIKKASANNLKSVNVKIPLLNMTCVTGVSGSGKSTLVNEVLYKHAYNHFHKDLPMKAGKCASIEGFDDLKKVIQIDQNPIGRTPRSNPATYIGVFDDIRDIFAALPESKARGYKKGRFSFNVRGGRCEECEGDGIKKIEMNFLPDVYVKCSKCNGKRYNEEVLQIMYKGKSIFDILNMEVGEAYLFFENIPKIKRKFKTLVDVGLSYLQVGTPATVLSGGEAQRIKLSKELQKVTKGHTLYILDEPTTGLHTDDIKKLIEVLQKLVDSGNTMIIIEHNLDLIKVSDYIIDIGPEGGDLGGEIIASCKLEKIVDVERSYTGKYLKPLL